MGERISTGRGSLTKRHTSDGWRWCGQLRYKDGSNRWRTMLRALTDDDGNPIPTDADTTDGEGNKVQTTRNIRKAKKALEAWRAEVRGTPLGGRSTVSDYIAADLDGRGGLHGSTMRKYREYSALIGRSPLARVQMRDLDTKTVRSFVRWMRDEGGRDGHGLKRSTIKTAYSLLNMTCRRAVQDGNMATNPCVRGLLKEEVPVPQTRAEVDATKPNALDAAGVMRANALLDSATNGRMRVGARLALTCGLRASECCALMWRDVDLDERIIHVTGAIGRAEGGTYDKPPKTSDSLRDIPIPPALCAELTAWRAVQEADHARASNGQERDVVPFCDCHVIGYADGGFLTPHALGNAWSRLVRAGDADGQLVGTRGRVCTFHDLRHTFATHAIASGGDARSVAALMGHKDASITMRIYADSLPDAKARAMDAVSPALAAGSLWATGEA